MKAPAPLEKAIQRDIVAAYRIGCSQKSLAQTYGVSPSTISNILRRNSARKSPDLLAIDRIAACQTPEAREKRSDSLRRPLADRFFAKVIKGADDNDCWLWTGSLDGHGYGQMRVERKNTVATHVSLLLDGRPRGGTTDYALHSCDNPPCTNPRHLKWGSAMDNTTEAMLRKRMNLTGLDYGKGRLGGILKEREIQTAIVNELRRRSIFVAHIPNGTHYSGDRVARFKQAAALKKQGLWKGIADLMCIKADGRVGFIEVKREGGVLSDEQKDFADRCGEWELPWACMRSVLDIDETLTRWGWMA